MTERLYYRDPYLCVFEADVVDRREIDGQFAVVLDATAFYPTGGGQPHDTGTLNDDVRVLDVQMAEDGEVLHLLDRSLSQTFIHGKVDWERRFDHMQQHTGQHILSQAFVQVCQAETMGFHLGERISTIDLDHSSLEPDLVEEAEKLANEVVLSSRQVVARFVDKNELAALPLRKMPVVEGPIRIVEIAEFDWSPCGGTHVCNSGEVGPIKVSRTERRGEQTRIHFLCGWRALSDYAYKQEIVQALAVRLTTSESEIMSSVQRMEAEIKESRKALTSAQMELLDYEVVEWIAQAMRIGEMRVVRLAFDQRDMSLLREAARRLIEMPSTVALLATCQPRAQFVFARSEDLAVDMGAVMRAACAVAGGRGGGRPQFAQGGAPEDSSVDQALDEAIRQLKATRVEGR